MGGSGAMEIEGCPLCCAMKACKFSWCRRKYEMADRKRCGVQIKYFKEKRVMEYNRDRTIEKIKADDAQMVAKQKADKKGRGLFG